MSKRSEELEKKLQNIRTRTALLRLATVQFKLATAFMRGGFIAAKDEAKRQGIAYKEAANILEEDK